MLEEQKCTKFKNKYLVSAKQKYFLHCCIASLILRKLIAVICVSDSNFTIYNFVG